MAKPRGGKSPGSDLLHDRIDRVAPVPQTPQDALRFGIVFHSDGQVDVSGVPRLATRRDGEPPDEGESRSEVLEVLRRALAASTTPRVLDVLAMVRVGPARRAGADEAISA
jgi:hypothetical protein